MKRNELKMRTATCLILHTVSGIAGITALFLPFIEDISPAGFVFNFFHYEFSDREDWLHICLWYFLPLAIPFFLSVFISAAFARWMISGLLSRTERAIAYVMSSMMALGILSSCVRCWLSGVISLVLLICGVYVVIKSLKNNGPMEISAVMAMQIVYLINALFCLILWINTWQIGAYFVVVTAGVYLTQIVMATVKLGVFQRGGESGSV